MGDDVNYREHKYTWMKPFGSVRHSWELIGRWGGIHFHVSLTPNFPPSCGLEVHNRQPAAYQNDDPPSQQQCWLLKCPCWHDGTSLYASETIWPIIEPMLRDGDHESIFRFLEREADSRFEEFAVRKCEAEP